MHFVHSTAHTFSSFLSNLSTFTSRNFRILHSCIVGLKLDSLCFSLHLYFDVFEYFHSLLSGSFSLLSSCCCMYIYPRVASFTTILYTYSISFCANSKYIYLLLNPLRKIPISYKIASYTSPIPRAQPPSILISYKIILFKFPFKKSIF
jgi:hypothetical protein